MVIIRALKLITLLAPLSVTAEESREVMQLRERINKTYQVDVKPTLLKEERSLFGCRIENFQLTGKDPVTHLDRQVHLSLYRPSKNKKSSAVIILPPTGGVNILDRGYANELCTHGITVALVTGWTHQNDISLDFDMHNHGALRSLAATRHVVEHLTSLNFNSLGLLGTSVGAVAGSLVLGFETRIKAAAFIAGGAHFRDIVATSDESGATKLRKERMEALGYKDQSEYSQAVYEEVWVEPSMFLNSRSDLSSLVISASKDTTVSTAIQLKLVDQLKPTHHIHRQGSHIKVIKDSFFYHRSDIRNFFLNAL